MGSKSWTRGTSQEEWHDLCEKMSLDPATGARVKHIYHVDYEKIAVDFDEWAKKMRAEEQAARKPAPPKRWRLRWVQE